MFCRTVKLCCWNCSCDRGPQILPSRAACVASPALEHYTKNRTLSGRTEKNHGNSVARVDLVSGQAWNTRRSEYVAHSIEMWQHVNYKIIRSVLQYLIVVLFPLRIPPPLSFFQMFPLPSFLPSPSPSAPTVHCAPYHVLVSVKITQLSSRVILRTSTESW